MELPKEILLEIFKYCCPRTLSALTMVCREYSPKMVDIELPTYGAHKEDPMRTIKRSQIWRRAKEAQFPNSPCLDFMNDDDAYMAAKYKSVMLRYSMYHSIASGIHEYNKLLAKYCEDDDRMYNETNIDHPIFVNIQFDITSRFILIILSPNETCIPFNDMATLYSYINDTTEMSFYGKSRDHHILIIDLAQTEINFSRYKTINEGKLSPIFIDFYNADYDEFSEFQKELYDEIYPTLT